MNPTHCFEKLQAKLCKNILGISKYTPENIVKAELGVYPLMGKIIKQILSYWQHVLSIPANSILYNTFYCNIEMDRNNNVSYYTRMKNLLAILFFKSNIFLFLFHFNIVYIVDNLILNQFKFILFRQKG